MIVFPVDPERMDLSEPYKPIEYAIHALRYLPALDRVGGKVVYDLGCGQGIGCRLLSDAGAKAVHGFDIDEQALRTAVRVVGSTVSVHECDLSEGFPAKPDLPTPDLVTCVETIEHLPDPRPLLRDLGKLAADGVSIVLSCPNDRFYYGPGPSLNPHHMDSYSWIAFRNLLEETMPDIAPRITWFVGTRASGFSLQRLDPWSHKGMSWLDVFEQRPSLDPMSAREIPGTLGNPTPRDSLFYVACINLDSRPAAALIPSAASYSQPSPSTVSRKTAIGLRQPLKLVVDSPKWAYDNIARQLIRHLGDRYVIDVLYLSEWSDDRDALMHELFFGERAVPGSIIHFFWREAWLRFITNPNRLRRFARRFGLSASELADGLSRMVVTGSIYDHLFLDDDEQNVHRRSIDLATFDAVSVSSSRLRRTYTSLGGEAPTAVLSDGVDTDLFRPRLDSGDESDERRPLRVGWVGNSAWNAKSGDDPKGLHTVLAPAMELLDGMGIEVELVLADRAVDHRPHEEMPDYYASIDVLVCSSLHEGTPNPVLEAMACGVPVVSTDVGVVRDVAGELQKSFIVGHRSPQAVAEKLASLAGDPDVRQRLGEENRRSAEKWAWESKMRDWLRFFARAESNHRAKSTLRASMIQTVVMAKSSAVAVPANPNERVAHVLQTELRQLRREIHRGAASMAELPRMADAIDSRDPVTSFLRVARRLKHGLRWRWRRMKRRW